MASSKDLRYGPYAMPHFSERQPMTTYSQLRQHARNVLAIFDKHCPQLSRADAKKINAARAAIEAKAQGRPRDLSDTEIDAALAECGSYAAAGRKLGVSPSTVQSRVVRRG